MSAGNKLSTSTVEQRVRAAFAAGVAWSDDDIRANRVQADVFISGRLEGEEEAAFTLWRAAQQNSSLRPTPSEVTSPILDPALEEHQGWERIGGVCLAGVHSMWMRLSHVTHYVPSQSPDGTLVIIDSPETVARIELRDGRGGCDSYAMIERGDPLFTVLLNVLLCARFVAHAPKSDLR